MKGFSSSTSSLVEKLASTDGMERQVILARAQLAVGEVLKFQGKNKGRSDYVVGLVTLVASSHSTSIHHRCKTSNDTYYLTVTCATKSKCEVRHKAIT